jgi:hypothetical protein
MKHYTNWKVLKEKEVNIAFNMGLQSAVYVLEKAEKLSPRGLRYLKDELKKNIVESDGGNTKRLLECISYNLD